MALLCQGMSDGKCNNTKDTMLTYGIHMWDIRYKLGDCNLADSMSILLGHGCCLHWMLFPCFRRVACARNDKYSRRGGSVLSLYLPRDWCMPLFRFDVYVVLLSWSLLGGARFDLL